MAIYFVAIIAVVRCCKARSVFLSLFYLMQLAQKKRTTTKKKSAVFYCLFATQCN